MSLDDARCECCNAEAAVAVASSGLGAISIAWGVNCLRNDAEPAWLVLGSIEDMSGPVPFVRDVSVADWVLDGVSVYCDGEYVLARDLAQCPTRVEVDRFVDEGCPNDLVSMAYQMRQDTAREVARLNAQHAATAPHDGCTCCSCLPLR